MKELGIKIVVCEDEIKRENQKVAKREHPQREV
jgi:hypothetical protein